MSEETHLSGSKLTGKEYLQQWRQCKDYQSRRSLLDRLEQTDLQLR